MDRAPIFRKPQPPPASSAIPSSPAFGTPALPPKPFSVPAGKAAILPIILPPATLRPLAFRTFTKKHSLTLTSSALQELAGFIGRHCGSGWREEGLGERVLEEAARAWKKRGGGVMVEGSKELQEILRALQGNMSGGRITGGASSRLGETDSLGLKPHSDGGTFGVSGLGQQDDDEAESENEAGADRKKQDVAAWLKIVDAYQQPRLSYNVAKRQFERDTSRPSLLPPASHKTAAFRNRFHVVHQRLLRHESFQASSVPSSRRPSTHHQQGQQSLKMTPIANLLGRHGSSHMLFGQLNVLPTGHLAMSDLTGTIALDVSQAVAIPQDSAWFCPGMMVLVDGVYEEEDESVGKGLSGSSGVGGTLGGRFQAFFIGQPPCERRGVTLSGGGFGWVDFLGVGSERAVGVKMRRVERRLTSPDSSPAHVSSSRSRVVILGEVNLDQPRALQALRKILTLYAAEPEGSSPMAFVLAGNFATHAVMARSGSGSIEYKEYFDALASALADFPSLLQSSTFIFVPGDNDGWVSAFTAGASTPLPQRGVPDMFTSRVRRAFANTNTTTMTTTNASTSTDDVRGSAVWTSNPSRISLFGPTHEIVLFRDDLSARLRRNSITLKQQQQQQQQEAMQLDNHVDKHDGDGNKEEHGGEPSVDTRSARKLVKTVLDQGFLAPFRQSTRALHWDYASALHLYPLPTAMALIDTSAPPFAISYEGCHVMNPGSILVPGRKGVARWIEYQLGRVGSLRECSL